ncbi:hypothetical protein Lal_00013451 [Lupinus albus]|uniref:Putative transcription factor bZIP family n=1 Tax=Lupinus albus TaxID=3870 RepID=A0A6A5LTA8_LUPAL|nr:putative transcription factor bZIP family [Lupinus albus]KAF1862690.1 hypothetical protein Lal_00013451 [Lupinus albus]
MATGEESASKPSKSSSSTQETSKAPSYPDWSSSMQAYYAPRASPPPFYVSTVASPSLHPYMWGSQHPLMSPYGTPVPYPTMYPPGSVYAHPSLAMTTSAMQKSTEFEARGPDGKDRDSAKKLKRASAKTESKAGESGKTGSGSANDGISQSAESGSEHSSNASDEISNHQESATKRKGSFNQMLVEGAESSKMRHNQSGAAGAAAPPAIMRREVTLGKQWMQPDEHELKRQKRKLSNRESARRSRLRKQAECEELQKRVETLGGENRILREELQTLSEDCEKLMSENNSIKEELERLCGQEAIANLG